jgi:hypothetical protein
VGNYFSICFSFINIWEYYFPYFKITPKFAANDSEIQYFVTSTPWTMKQAQFGTTGADNEKKTIKLI